MRVASLAARTKGRLKWDSGKAPKARAISSRKDVPGYAVHRNASARQMAEEITRHHG